MTDFACQFSGYVSVPVATTVPMVQVAAILTQTNPLIAVCGPKQIPILFEALTKTPTPCIQHLVIVHDKGTPTGLGPGPHPFQVRSWDDLITITENFEPLRPSTNNGQVVTLIFSSGSTGTPKAAMIDDQSLNAEFARDSMVPQVIFSYEPLAYSTQRFLAYGALSSGGLVFFFSGNMENFFQELKEASPSSFSGPPRIWNVLYAIYKAKVEANDRILQDDETRQKR